MKSLLIALKILEVQVIIVDDFKIYSKIQSRGNYHEDPIHTRFYDFLWGMGLLRWAFSI